MRRLRRILLNSVTIMSSLLLVLTTVLWGRGYFYHDGVSYVRKAAGRYEAWSLSNFGGSIVYTSSSGSLSRHDPKPGLSVGSVAGRADSFLVRWSHYGFWAFSSNMYGGASDGGIPFTQAGVPHWFIVVATGLLPTVRCLRRRGLRARSKQVGVCRKCGYDLRATPTRCPECGATGVKA